VLFNHVYMYFLPVYVVDLLKLTKETWCHNKSLNVDVWRMRWRKNCEPHLDSRRSAAPVQNPHMGVPNLTGTPLSIYSSTHYTNLIFLPVILHIQCYLSITIWNLYITRNENYYVHLCVYCTKRASHGICLHPMVGLCFIHSILAIWKTKESENKITARTRMTWFEYIARIEWIKHKPTTRCKRIPCEARLVQ
jgi:hypothetical protein